jgi:meckelin
VNPWRRLFVINEFSELQTSKSINSETVLLVFLLIAEGFGLKYFATMEPDFSRNPSDSPTEYVLNFFVIFMIVFGIGIVNRALMYVMSPFSPPQYVDFVDLCSIANISIIMFNSELKGYYIHGKSSTGNSDVSSEKLRLSIQNEIEGNATVRGIHPSYPDAQSFEIYLPNGMIKQYRQSYMNQVNNEVQKQIVNGQTNYNAIMKAFSNSSSLPT